MQFSGKMSAQLSRIGGLSLSLSLGCLAFLFAALRIEDPGLHQIVSLGILGIALCGLCLAALTMPKRISTRLALSIPTGLAALLYPLALALSMVGGGPIAEYEVMSTIQVRGDTVVAYRMNGGVTVPYRIHVLHTRRIIPGLTLARTLHNRSRESAVSLKLTAPDKVTASFSGGGPYNAYAEVYKISPFVILSSQL